MRQLLPAGLCFLFFALLTRAEVQRVAGQEAPNEILPRLFVLSADWAEQIPPAGPVNAPAFFTTLHPGQRIALGLLAKGPDRDRLFDGVSLTMRPTSFTNGGGSGRDLRPVTVRPIKAEGTDFALMALKAAGIGEAERGKLEKATALVTLAVFVPEWTVPMDGGEADFELRVEVTGAAVPVVPAPVHLKIRTAADWAKEPPLTDGEISKQMNRFRGDLSPGQLLAWFGVLAKSHALKAPPVSAFFCVRVQGRPGCTRRGGGGVSDTGSRKPAGDVMGAAARRSRFAEALARAFRGNARDLQYRRAAAGPAPSPAIPGSGKSPGSEGHWPCHGPVLGRLDGHRGQELPARTRRAA
jgi:hypothetical protein